MSIPWSEATKNEDIRHGGPWDRGTADSYYNRPKGPHYYVGPTAMSERVECQPGTPEYDAYIRGYEWHQTTGDRKSYD